MSDFQDAYDAGQKAGVRHIVVQGRSFVLLRTADGSEDLREVNEWPFPPRKKGFPVFDEEASFSFYTRMHKTAGAAIYAQQDKGVLVAVLDGHRPNDEEGEGDAGYGEHRAVLKLRPSLEWAAWSAIHRRTLPQADFVEFLEDHIGDVLRPDGADLLELCRDLSGRKTIDFQSGKNLKNGTVQLRYIETVEGSSTRGEFEVPEFLTLALPVYFGEAARELRARLRWSINDGKLKFAVVIERLEMVAQEAFREIAERVKGSASVMTFYGAPG